jgi:hypothetical protein
MSFDRSRPGILTRSIPGSTVASCADGNSSAIIPAGFAQTNAGSRPSATSAGAQAKSSAITDAHLFLHSDALIAGIDFSLVAELDSIARPNAGSTHGDQHAASETKMRDFYSSTRDRTRVHAGVSVFNGLK